MTRLLSAKEAKELANQYADEKLDTLLEEISDRIKHECELGNYECGYILSEEDYKTCGYSIIKRLKDYGYCVDAESQESRDTLFTPVYRFILTISWKSYNEPKPTE